MTRLGLAAAAALALAGCAHSSIEQPVQRVVDEYGAPTNVVDLPDGRRLFQWWWSDALVMEESVYDRSPEWWTSNGRRAGGSPLPADCATDVTGRWDDSRGAWIVQQRRGPGRDCGMRR